MITVFKRIYDQLFDFWTGYVLGTNTQLLAKALGRSTRSSAWRWVHHFQNVPVKRIRNWQNGLYKALEPSICITYMPSCSHRMTHSYCCSQHLSYSSDRQTGEHRTRSKVPRGVSPAENSSSQYS